jgi:hypothetical protein
MANFGELLARFKGSEEPENIVAIVDDEELRKGLVAWKSVVVKYKEAGECPHKEEAAMWNWMWEYVEFDLAAFGTVAGAKSQDVSRMFQRLKGLRLIYPDGTMNKLAKQYLQTTIASKLKMFQPKPVRAAAPAKPAEEKQA